MLWLLIVVWLIGLLLFLVAMLLEPGNGEPYRWRLLLPVIACLFWPAVLVGLIFYVMWEKWKSRTSVRPKPPRRRYRRKIWPRSRLLEKSDSKSSPETGDGP